MPDSSGVSQPVQRVGRSGVLGGSKLNGADGSAPKTTCGSVLVSTGAPLKSGFS